MEYSARTPRQLGQILKGCREKRGLTQSEVSARVGLRQAQVSTIEVHGAGTVSVAALYKLISALGLELVLKDSGVPGPSPLEW